MLKIEKYYDVLEEVEAKDTNIAESINVAIKENRKNMEKNEKILDMVSINRYLPKPMKNLFSLEEAINPLSTLLNYDFSIAENPLNFGYMPLSDKKIVSMLQKYEDIGYTYLSNKINHKIDIRDEITEENEDGEEVTLGELANSLVICHPVVPMTMGDELPFNRFFEILLPLLEYKVSETNLVLMLNGDTKIYKLK